MWSATSDQGKRLSKRSNDCPPYATGDKNKQGQDKDPAEEGRSHKRSKSSSFGVPGISLEVPEVDPPKFPAAIPPRVPPTSQGSDLFH